MHWSVDDAGLVQVQKRKFGAFGSRLLSLFFIRPFLKVRLDAMGSEVWLLLDGKRTVAAVLQQLQADHPDEPNLPDRLGRYLGAMAQTGLVRLR